MVSFSCYYHVSVIYQGYVNVNVNVFFIINVICCFMINVVFMLVLFVKVNIIVNIISLS